MIVRTDIIDLNSTPIRAVGETPAAEAGMKDAARPMPA
jgi:hypothetical protein